MTEPRKPQTGCDCGQSRVPHGRTEDRVSILIRETRTLGRYAEHESWCVHRIGATHPGADCGRCERGDCDR